MKLCMIGVGYVGLVSGVCFSDLGNDVICLDKDKEKINNLKKGIVPKRVEKPWVVQEIGRASCRERV